MEETVGRNIHFMWLAAMSIPDHNTIKAKREKMKAQLNELWEYAKKVAAFEMDDTVLPRASPW